VQSIPHLTLEERDILPGAGSGDSRVFPFTENTSHITFFFSSLY
jgi:hypothetical protein